jgi:hypothetical protein
VRHHIDRSDSLGLAHRPLHNLRARPQGRSLLRNASAIRTSPNLFKIRTSNTPRTPKGKPFEIPFFSFFCLKIFFGEYVSGTGRGTPGTLKGSAAGVGQRLAARKMGADLDSWIAKVRACEYLPENDLKQLCQMVFCVSAAPAGTCRRGHGGICGCLAAPRLPSRAVCRGGTLARANRGQARGWCLRCQC